MAYDFDAVDIAAVARHMPVPAPTFPEMVAHWRGDGGDHQDIAKAIMAARRGVFARRGPNVRRMAGDWMDDAGYIDNINRRRMIEVYQHPDGRWWVYDQRYGDSPIKAVAHGEDAPVIRPALTPDEDAAGMVCIGGNFCPDAGELERIGMPVEHR